MKVLVTGSAGFIGYHLSERLLKSNVNVVGVDNFNDYYDVGLKNTRTSILEEYPNFKLYRGDIQDTEKVNLIFKHEEPDIVINLAAQAGVRYSIENPKAYIDSNIIGFYNILEACREHPVEHLIYASSSSVYGANTKVPFSESDFVDTPVSLYAATKKSNELMASAYSHLYSIPSSGLRFFTVYGPLGRPDMAYYNFVNKYFSSEPIKVFNNGDFNNDMYRDFTYIDDIVEGIVRLMEIPPHKENKFHEIYNIGNNSPEKLMDFINTLEVSLSSSLGETISFIKEFEAIKPGDVHATFASTDKIEKAIGFKPQTSISDGLKKFTDWYVQYYKKKEA